MNKTDHHDFFPSRKSFYMLVPKLIPVFVGNLTLWYIFTEKYHCVLFLK